MANFVLKYDDSPGLSSKTCFVNAHIRYYSTKVTLYRLSVINWTVWKVNILFSLSLDAAKPPINWENKGYYFEEEIGL